MDAPQKKASPQSLSPEQEAHIKRILGLRPRRSRAKTLTEKERLTSLQQYLLQHQQSFLDHNIRLTSCMVKDRGLETIWQDQECQTVISIILVNDQYCFIPRLQDLGSENLGKRVLQILRKSLCEYGTST
jgi:hypothetical protein